MNDLYNSVESVSTKEDFVNFITLLITDLKEGEVEWENASLERYLDAIANWTEDMDQYYINQKLPVPKNVNWKVFASILAAATIYE